MRYQLLFVLSLILCLTGGANGQSSPTLSANLYIDRGNAYFSDGMFQRAIEDYTIAVTFDPDSAVGYFNRGNAWRISGDLDRALADYDRSIELAPGLGDNYANRCIVKYLKGDYAGAVSDATAALQTRQKSAIIYYYRGSAYDEMGCVDEALADYNRAISLKLDLLDVYVRRALIRVNRGDTEGANADSRYALRMGLHPTGSAGDSDSSRRNRGFSPNGVNSFVEQSGDFKSSLWSTNELAVSHNYRGTAYLIISDREKAMADYNRAIELNPNLVDAYNNRAIVKRRSEERRVGKEARYR